MVAEVSQRRPTTGKVASIGEAVRGFKVGDNVLFSNFAGHAMDVGDVTLRILHETEILASVKGHLELSRVKNQREALGV